MRAFARLFRALDESNRTLDKVAALVRYLEAAPPGDAAWAIHFLAGNRPKRPVNTTKLALWANELAGLPEWLFQESYDAVGDLAETLAILIPPSPERQGAPERPLREVVERYVLGAAGVPEDEAKALILQAWREMDALERFVFNKLITGSFRVGVSTELVVRAVAQVGGLAPNVVAHRMMGTSAPTPEFVASLYSTEVGDADATKPYPFMLAHPLDAPPETLGPVEDWCAEWKWDGLRAQVLHRRGEISIWSRGEDLMTERFPEVAAIARRLPEGTVIDGEILAWRSDPATGGRPMKFAELQKRIGRKTLGKKILADVPAALVAFDLLEDGGEDLRGMPLSERRRRLERVAGELTAPVDESAVDVAPDPALSLRLVAPGFLVALPLTAEGWEALAAARAGSRGLNVEGLMLKRWDAEYGVGRRKGGWWKWKIEPMTVDAVLVYAQRGSGKRASLYTDYTFAVWDGGEGERRLVPFAKAYSGLTDAEIRRLDGFIRRNTVDKFGPVRSVTPTLVFELAFEGIALSPRHKSGVAVRFPRILRQREDKGPEAADTLESIRAMIRAEENPATATVRESGDQDDGEEGDGGEAGSEAKNSSRTIRPSRTV